jgi:competence protein ComFC
MQPNHLPPPPERTRSQRFGALLLDLLYPGECKLCRDPLPGGRALCDACHDGFPQLTAPFCDTCGEPFPGLVDVHFDCPNCSTLEFAFEFARPAMSRDPRLREMIHLLKYSRQLHLAAELGRIASGALVDPRFAPALAENWPLVPVPLHKSRLRFRHFNQAEEIARPLARLSGLPVLRALDRTRATATQTALTRAQRLQNLNGAFALSRVGQRALATPPGGLILVDDVFTTGSTVQACAKVLRRAGFRRIAVITVMRG